MPALAGRVASASNPTQGYQPASDSRAGVMLDEVRDDDALKRRRPAWRAGQRKLLMMLTDCGEPGRQTRERPNPTLGGVSPQSAVFASPVLAKGTAAPATALPACPPQRGAPTH